MNPLYDRMTRRSDRLALVTLAGLALVWGIFALDPAAWPGLSGALVQSGLLLANVALTRRAPRVKARLVAALQRRVVNPLVRGLYRLGVNPLGIALLETTGRRSGRVRQVPVGDGRDGEVFWVVAEHGMRAGCAQPAGRSAGAGARAGGWRRRWRDGVATVLKHDDPFARQRVLVRGHPLRALNAASVRLLGAEPVTVRIDLLSADSPPVRDQAWRANNSTPMAPGEGTFVALVSCATQRR